MCLRQSDLPLSHTSSSSSSSHYDLGSFEESETSVLPSKLFVIQSFALGGFHVEDKDTECGGVLVGCFQKVIIKEL